MNIHSPPARSTSVKLTVEDVLRLRGSGTFAGYSAIELLDGELFGVPDGPGGEPENDRTLPIKLSADDFAMLDAAGAFATYERTELLDGMVYAMSPEYRPHAFVKDELQYRLRRALEASGSPLRSATGSVRLSDYDMPMPDIVLTTEPRGSGPIPDWAVALVIEVSSTTLTQDIGVKAGLYASARIAEYWVVDVDGEQIHQLWAPVAGTYTERRTIPFGNEIASATIEGLAIATDTLA